MDGLNIPVADAVRRQTHYGMGGRRRQRHFLKTVVTWLPFMFVVGMPTAASTYYYCAIAAYQYVSEAKFVVRGPAVNAPSGLSGLLEGAGIGRAQDDTYSVHDYILSRDALAELVRANNIPAIFARPEADGLARFPNFMSGDSFEHLYKYYLKHVDVEIDSTTGVTDLTVQVFRAADAKLIATALLTAAENLVNRMNARERENALREARNEVARSERLVQTVGLKIAAFRNRETMIDPGKQSLTVLEGISNLQSKLAAVNTQLAELQRSSPNSPLITTTARRAAVLQGQIIQQRALVAGSDQSMVPKITEYDELTLEREFADKQLASSTTSLEAARAQSERQQFYLDTIVQPNEADYYAYPRRISSISLVFAVFFGIYTISKLIVIGAREHRTV